MFCASKWFGGNYCGLVSRLRILDKLGELLVYFPLIQCSAEAIWWGQTLNMGLISLMAQDFPLQNPPEGLSVV